MLRKLVVSLIGLSALVLSTLSSYAQDNSVTIIETRPFYGATVTIERGVRVTRAFPSNKHIIINPFGETPLRLSIKNVNKTVTKTVTKNSTHNHYYIRRNRNLVGVHKRY